MATLSVALRRPRRRLRQRDIVPYIFILPNLILFSVFVLGPVVFSFGMSFTNWDGLGPATFTGLRNYAKLLTDDLFATAARNTLVYSFGTVLPMMATRAMLSNSSCSKNRPATIVRLTICV